MKVILKKELVIIGNSSSNSKEYNLRDGKLVVTKTINRISR